MGIRSHGLPRFSANRRASVIECSEENADGSITINFGGGPNAINNLPITPGWNYIVRMYQPKQAIINGSWSFPKAQPAE